MAVDRAAALAEHERCLRALGYEGDEIVSLVESAADLWDVAANRNGTQAHARTAQPDEIEFAPELPKVEPPWYSQTWSQFRDESTEPLRFLVRGLWPTASLGFISAPPKKGKTWIGLALALSIATGRPLFGEYQIEEARDVLYVALEGARSGLRARTGCLLRGLGLDPDGDLDRLHMLYRPRPFNLADLEGARWLTQESRRVEAALVIVDVLRQAARNVKEASAADFAIIRDALDPLLADGRSVALLHHFGKLTDLSKERTPGERMAGTGAMYGALDVGLFITKSEGGARRLRLELEARDFATPEPIGVAIVGTGTGEHGGFTYLDRGEIVLDATAAEERDLVAELEQLFQDGRWRTTKEAATKKTGIGANPDDVRDALTGAPERFASVEGPRVGRHATAHPWGTAAMLLDLAEEVTSDPESPESPPLFSDLQLAAEQVTPLRGDHPESPAPLSAADDSPPESAAPPPMEDDIERLLADHADMAGEA